MRAQPVQRLIKRCSLLAEAEPDEMADVGPLIERADRHGGDPGLGCDVATKFLVSAIETQRPEIGGDEITPLTIENAKTNVL